MKDKIKADKIKADKIKAENIGLTLWSLILPTNILVRAYASWSVFTFSPTYRTHSGMKARIGWLRTGGNWQ
jgi:hypothetical protein